MAHDRDAFNVPGNDRENVHGLRQEAPSAVLLKEQRA